MCWILLGGRSHRACGCCYFLLDWVSPDLGYCFSFTVPQKPRKIRIWSFMCLRDFDILQEPQGAAVDWCYVTILPGSKMDLFKSLSRKASTGCVFRGKNQRLSNTALFLPCGLQEKFRRRLSQIMPEAETWMVARITTTHISVTHSCQKRLPWTSSVVPLKQSSHSRYCQQAQWQSEKLKL